MDLDKYGSFEEPEPLSPEEAVKELKAQKQKAEKPSQDPLGLLNEKGHFKLFLWDCSRREQVMFAILGFIVLIIYILSEM